jgi:hypothetical protein
MEQEQGQRQEEKAREQKEKKFVFLPNRTAYVLLGLTVCLISSVFAFQTLCVSWGNGTSSCTGIPALWIRDQQIAHSGIIPYLNYPFEYPLMSGAVMLVINILSSGSLLLALFLSSIFMGVFALGDLALFYLMKIDWKRAAVFSVFAPLMWQYGLSFEYEQMFFFLLALYLFRRQKESTSALLLGLSALVKYVPIVTIPYFFCAEQEKRKIKFLVISLGSFFAGLAIQFLLNPANFLRALSYLSSYGVEGSWLGLIFGHVINYGSEKSWQIGTSTAISFPKAYQIASAICIVSCLFFISKKGKGGISLEEKCFWAFSAVYLFFWIAAPQNFMNVALMLPLVKNIKLKLSVLVPYFLASMFSFELLLLYVFRYGEETSFYLNLVAQGFFLIMILSVYYGLFAVRYSS